MSETRAQVLPKSKRGKHQVVTTTSRAARIRETVTAWGMLSPAVIILGLMVGFPFFTMVWQSFTDYTVKNKLTGEPANFIGFDNYKDLFSNPDFTAVLIRSLVMMVILTTLIMVGGMLVALLMQRLTKPWRLVISVGLLLAWAMPQLTSTVLWGWIFDSEYGLVNWALQNITGDSKWFNHSWLMNPFSFMSIIVIIVVWQSIPFAAFSFYAGLEQIPGEILEASEIDGASPWQRFWQITMPFMRNIVTGVLVLEVIWTMRIFTQVYGLQQRGGLASETNVIGTYLFRSDSSKFGMTAAVGMVMLVILVVLSIANVRRTLKEEEL